MRTFHRIGWAPGPFRLASTLCCAYSTPQKVQSIVLIFPLAQPAFWWAMLVHRTSWARNSWILRRQTNQRTMTVLCRPYIIQPLYADRLQFDVQTNDFARCGGSHGHWLGPSTRTRAVNGSARWWYGGVADSSGRIRKERKDSRPSASRECLLPSRLPALSHCTGR